MLGDRLYGNSNFLFPISLNPNGESFYISSLDFRVWNITGL